MSIMALVRSLGEVDAAGFQNIYIVCVKSGVGVASAAGSGRAKNHVGDGRQS